MSEVQLKRIVDKLNFILDLKGIESVFKFFREEQVIEIREKRAIESIIQDLQRYQESLLDEQIAKGEQDD